MDRKKGGINTYFCGGGSRKKAGFNLLESW